MKVSHYTNDSSAHSGGSEMSPELFVFIMVVGAASGLIYAASISKRRKDQRRE